FLGFSTQPSHVPLDASLLSVTVSRRSRCYCWNTCTIAAVGQCNPRLKKRETSSWSRREEWNSPYRFVLVRSCPVKLPRIEVNSRNSEGMTRTAKMTLGGPTYW